MIKYCREKWDKNQEKLREFFETSNDLLEYDYEDLLIFTITYILNDGNDLYSDWDAGNIHKIDDGDYQGTLLFLIPTANYQPEASDYLMTYVAYGSCSWCDLLQNIKSKIDYSSSKEYASSKMEIVDDYMTLCRDMVVRMIRPYNTGWRNRPEFDEVEEEI